jgi:glycosyltransferase involved in cell wall biosynthesis
MQVLFVHKEFPGQFGHIARYLASKGIECTFVYSALPARYQGRLSESEARGIRLIPYRSRGASRDTHFCNRHLEISLWHSQEVYETLKKLPDIKPDVVVGHSVYGTAIFLQDLYGCPLVVHCEYFERPGKPYLYGRPDFPPTEADILQARIQNASNLLNLQACSAGYSPTRWQRDLFPAEYQHKIATIFDGIDREFWFRRSVPRRLGHWSAIPAGTRIVTYCSYGMEAARGIDIFMRVAQRICKARSDVVFVIVGADRPIYADDTRRLGGRSLLQRVLSEDCYDLSRFLFTGQIMEQQLVEILSLSDLHIYLTIPFVLSWSMMDALACGCTVLASATAPVLEMIRHEENGLLADFDDIDGLTRVALQVLDDPQKYRPLGQAAVQFIDDHYSLERTAPQLLNLLQRAIRGESPTS